MNTVQRLGLASSLSRVRSRYQHIVQTNVIGPPRRNGSVPSLVITPRVCLQRVQGHTSLASPQLVQSHDSNVTPRAREPWGRLKYECYDLGHVITEGEPAACERDKRDTQSVTIVTQGTREHVDSSSSVDVLPPGGPAVTNLNRMIIIKALQESSSHGDKVNDERFMADCEILMTYFMSLGCKPYQILECPQILLEPWDRIHWSQVVALLRESGIDTLSVPILHLVRPKDKAHKVKVKVKKYLSQLKSYVTPTLGAVTDASDRESYSCFSDVLGHRLALTTEDDLTLFLLNNPKVARLKNKHAFFKKIDILLEIGAFLPVIRDNISLLRRIKLSELRIMHTAHQSNNDLSSHLAHLQREAAQKVMEQLLQKPSNGSDFMLSEQASQHWESTSADYETDTDEGHLPGNIPCMEYEAGRLHVPLQQDVVQKHLVTEGMRSQKLDLDSEGSTDLADTRNNDEHIDQSRVVEQCKDDEQSVDTPGDSDVALELNGKIDSVAWEQAVQEVTSYLPKLRNHKHTAAKVHLLLSHGVEVSDMLASHSIFRHGCKKIKKAFEELIDHGVDNVTVSTVLHYIRTNQVGQTKDRARKLLAAVSGLPLKQIPPVKLRELSLAHVQNTSVVKRNFNFLRDNLGFSTEAIIQCWPLVFHNEHILNSQWEILAADEKFREKAKQRNVGVLHYLQYSIEKKQNFTQPIVLLEV